MSLHKFYQAIDGDFEAACRRFYNENMLQKISDPIFGRALLCGIERCPGVGTIVMQQSKRYTR